MRTPPPGAQSTKVWEEFLKFEESLTFTFGDDPDDFIPWWECFLAGFAAGMLEGKKE